MEKTLPIYFLTAHDYRRFENALAQLADILDLVYATSIQEPELEEDPLMA